MANNATMASPPGGQATITVRLPRKYMDDHLEIWDCDGLPCPEGRFTANEWVGPVTKEQLAEIISRADYYADPTGFCEDVWPLCRSGLRTLVKARKYLEAWPA